LILSLKLDKTADLTLTTVW